MNNEIFVNILDKDLLNIYVISKNGKIKNINTSHIYSQKETNGYMKVKLMDKNGKYKDKSVSRLVGLTYLDIPQDFNKKNYVINHKDGNKLNNHFSNLEWITQKENIVHGCGRKIAKINKDTDEVIKTYNSIIEAYKELNKPWNSLISKVCNGEKGRKTIYGFKWKYINL